MQVELVTDALSRMPRLDDTEAYDCNDGISCAAENETLALQPPFALDLGKVSKKTKK